MLECVCYCYCCAFVDVFHHLLCLLQESIMEDVKEHFTRTLRHGGKGQVSVQQTHRQTYTQRHVQLSNGYITVMSYDIISLCSRSPEPRPLPSDDLIALLVSTCASLVVTFSLWPGNVTPQYLHFVSHSFAGDHPHAVRLWYVEVLIRDVTSLATSFLCKYLSNKGIQRRKSSCATSVSFPDYMMAWE